MPENPAIDAPILTDKCREFIGIIAWLADLGRRIAEAEREIERASLTEPNLSDYRSKIAVLKRQYATAKSTKQRAMRRTK